MAQNGAAELDFLDLPPRSVMFDGSRLTAARQALGLTTEKLAGRIGMSKSSVDKWESGPGAPSASAVRKLCRVLEVGPEYFLPTGAEIGPSSPYFRSRYRLTALEQDRGQFFGQLFGELVISLARVSEIPAVDLPTLPVEEHESIDRAKEAARYLRREWKVPKGPIERMTRLVESHGIAVTFSLPEDQAIDAYAMFLDDRPIIVRNPQKRDYYRGRFDVAHELGHLVMHHDRRDRGQGLEDQADAFATELLAPDHEIARHLPSVTTQGGWKVLSTLKERWGVSLAVLLRRARDIEAMSETTYRNAMNALARSGWDLETHARMRVLEPTLLIPTAVESLDPSERPRLASGIPQRYFEAMISRIPLRGPIEH